MSESDQGTFSDWLNVLKLAQEAHHAASQANWERFLELEDSYVQALLATQQRPVEVAGLDDTKRQAFAELVQQVIALHQETVQWAEVHRDALASELGMVNKHSKVLKAYGYGRL